MARIRSIHPGQWTDEEFVSLSFAARLLAIALRNEADDQGVFEWKPVGLKMRLMPADNVDLAVLLDELIEKRAIMRFEIDGRMLGAIRNFRRYQKPKIPNSVHPITDEIRNWVGLAASVSEVDDADDGEISEIGTDNCHKIGEMDGGKKPAFPPKLEMDALMEDGGGNRRKESSLRSDSSGRGPSARGPATPLPEAWLPTANERDYARKLGLSDGDVDREAVKFRAYWTTGRGSGQRRSAKGWRQSWQNWIAKASERLPPSTAALVPAVRDQSPGTATDRDAAAGCYLRDLEVWKRDAAHGNPTRPEPKLEDYLPKEAAAA